MKPTRVDWGTISRAAVGECREDDAPGLAAEMAYWIIVSIFPFFASLVTLASIVSKAIYGGPDQVVDNIAANFLATLPPATRETVRQPLHDLLTPGNGALTLGVLVAAVLALNSSSAAVDTVMKAFNRAYDVEETRTFAIRKLTSLVLTLVLVLLLLGGSLSLTLAGTLADRLNFGCVGHALILVGRVAVALLVGNLALAILYWKGPNLRQQFRWITPGSVLATTGLVVLSALFGLYVSMIGQNSYTKTYGALAGVILFLFFLRLASMIILFGAEFNAETTERYDPVAIRDKAADPGKQPPGKQARRDPQAQQEAGAPPQQVAGDGAAVGAVARSHATRVRLTPAEQARRVRAVLATFCISLAIALGELLFAAIRRWTHRTGRALEEA